MQQRISKFTERIQLILTFRNIINQNMCCGLWEWIMDECAFFKPVTYIPIGSNFGIFHYILLFTQPPKSLDSFAMCDKTSRAKNSNSCVMNLIYVGAFILYTTDYTLYVCGFITQHNLFNSSFSQGVELVHSDSLPKRLRIIIHIYIFKRVYSNSRWERLSCFINDLRMMPYQFIFI